MPTHQPPIYRRAERADIPAMSAIRLAVTENVLSDPGRITAAMYEDYLDRSGRGWVAEIDDTIVAFCYADSIDGSIWALFVQPGWEGQGLARYLLGLAVEWLFATGHKSVALTTAAGTRADRFYAAQGWRRLGLCDDGRNVEYVLDRDSWLSPAASPATPSPSAPRAARRPA